jgi:immunity protein Imm5 of predicted polymorphic toxin system
VTDPRIAAESLAQIPAIDSSGELPLTVRRGLARSLLDLLGDDRRALEFTALLGSACAEKAWPVWQSGFVSESRPIDLARAAVSRMGGAAETEAELQELGEVKTYLDNKFLLGEEYFPAVYAGFAAWAVARDVISGHPPNVAGNSELEIAPEEWDPCFLASLAITGGATWEGIGDPDIRRSFWEWYLITAVPESFAEAAKI